MKKLGMVGVALAGVLLLAGCGEASGVADAETARESATVETAAPLVAETPPTSDVSNTDALYLSYVRDNLPPETQIPDATDEQLFAAGQEACTRLEAGEPMGGMVVVEGEEPWENGYYYDSSAIINGAIQYICPGDY